MLKLFSPLVIAALAIAATQPATAQTFGSTQVVPINAGAESIAIADFDGNGTNEILISTGWGGGTPTGRLVVVEHDPIIGARVTREHQVHTNYVARVPHVVLKRAGQTPLAVVANGSLLYTVRWDGQAFSQTSITTVKPADYLVAVDLDLDGQDELVAHSWGAGGVVYRIDATGTALQQSSVFLTGAAGYNDLAQGDVTGDGAPDVVVMSGQSYAAPDVSILAGDGTGTLAAPVTFNVPGASETGRGIAVGDLNADGRDDIVVTRGRNSPTLLWQYLQSAAGEMELAPLITAYDIPSEALIGDIDLDGSSELFVLHSGWSRLSVYRTDDQGVIPGAESLPVPYMSHYGSNALAMGDIDGDGCPDIGVANGSAGVAILYGRECIPPPVNDLKASISAGRTSLTATASSLSGTAAAQAASVSVSFTATRDSLTVTAPATCSAVAQLEWICPVADLSVGDSTDLTFKMDTRGRLNVVVDVTVGSKTDDPNLDNNVAQARLRL